MVARSCYEIDELYAYLIRDELGEEYVAGADCGGRVLPLIGNKRFVTRLQPVACELARASGRDLRLAVFTRRQDLLAIDGRSERVLEPLEQPDEGGAVSEHWRVPGSICFVLAVSAACVGFAIRALIG